MNGPIYRFDPNAEPDSAFVPGELRHLVAGNEGRLLDARRTPIRITAVAAWKAAFELEILAFEDVGARWELPLEDIGRFQFRADARLTPAEVVDELERAVARTSEVVSIECDGADRQRTLTRVDAEQASVRDWLNRRGATVAVDVQTLIDRRRGDEGLSQLAQQYLDERGLAELDRRFAQTFVSNPQSGELVKGHAIVLAELGLCPYRGKAVRDPSIFDEPWSKRSRAEHLIVRLALTHELCAQAALDQRTVTLYRGAATDGPLPERCPSSFVSATFSRAVAEAHFEGGADTQTAVLWRQDVPIARLLMTFLETRAMNARFAEAEAVLIADPDNRAF